MAVSIPAFNSPYGRIQGVTSGRTITLPTGNSYTLASLEEVR